MTVAVRNGVRCKKCGAALECPECGEKVTASTPFSDWLRALPFPLDCHRVSNQNLDYIWHVYKDDWLITLEEKRYGGKSDFAQRDTHGVVAQMLACASGCTVRTERGVMRPIHYRGHYVLTFEKTTPANSAWMLCNDKPLNLAGLLRLLRTGSVNKEQVAS